MPVSRILQHRKTDQIKQRVNQYPVQMPVRAEQLTKLADSYRKEEQRRKPVIREDEEKYVCAEDGESPGTALLTQAKELKSAAESWFHRAREEYHSSLQEIRLEEERAGKW